ncbi:MAG: type III-A CRISPR-associated RAMP protein Csm5 [Pleomorphochaeta sp.]
MNKIKNWTTYNVKINILTPVIINSGDAYEYGELFFDKESNKLYKINLLNLIKTMDSKDREKYINAVSEGIETRAKHFDNTAKALILKTLKDNPTEIPNIIARPLSYLSSGEDLLKNKPFQSIEKSIVKKINDKPYIPGSSIKGALRTALIQSIVSNKDIKENDYIENFRGRDKYIKTKDFESFVMNVRKGDVKNDPFKFIKVSDFEFLSPSINGYIGEVSIKTKRKPLSVFTSMSDALCISNKTVSLKGTISISSEINNYSELSKFSKFKEILNSLNDFYIQNYNEKRYKLPNKVQDSMREIINENLLDDSALLKLGRFSGIENITYNIEQNMSINRKIKNEKINIEGGNSYALINNLFLPGYCIISEVED